MPTIVDVKTSWADEVELEGGVLPPPTEVYDNNLKIVTEYKLNEDSKKVILIKALQYSYLFRMIFNTCVYISY